MNTNKNNWHLPPWQCGKLPPGVTRRCYVGARKTVRHFNLMNFCHDQDTAAMLVACRTPKHAQSRKNHGLVDVDQHPKRLILEFLAGKPFPCDHHWHAGLVYDAQTFFNGLCPVCDDPVDNSNTANDGHKNKLPFAGVCCDCGIAHAPCTGTLTASERSEQVMHEVNNPTNFRNPKNFVNEIVVKSNRDASIFDSSYKKALPWRCTSCGELSSGTRSNGFKATTCAFCLSRRYVEDKNPRNCFPPFYIHKRPILFHDTAKSHWKLRCDRCEATYRAIGASSSPGQGEASHCKFCRRKCENCIHHVFPCHDDSVTWVGEPTPVECGPNSVTCCAHISTACRHCKLHNPEKIPEGYGHSRVQGEPGQYRVGAQHWCPDSDRAIYDTDSVWVPDEQFSKKIACLKT